MQPKFFAVVIALVAVASVTADAKPRQLIIRTDPKGNVVDIQGVPASQISTDKLGIVLRTRRGVDKVVVLSQQTPNSTLNVSALAKEVEEADPYALKLIIHLIFFPVFLFTTIERVWVDDFETLKCQQMSP